MYRVMSPLTSVHDTSFDHERLLMRRLRLLWWCVSMVYPPSGLGAVAEKHSIVRTKTALLL